MNNPIQLTKILFTAALLLGSPMAWSAANSSDKNLPDISPSEANQVISSYRELRDSCSEGNYEDRRTCLNKLSKANAQYRQAKRIIEQIQFEDSGQSTLSLR